MVGVRGTGASQTGKDLTDSDFSLSELGADGGFEQRVDRI